MSLLFYFEEEEKQQVRVALTTGGYVRPCFTAEEKWLLKSLCAQSAHILKGRDALFFQWGRSCGNDEG